MDFIAGGLVELVGGARVGGRAVRLRVVGAARARRRLARRRTGCCARAASGSDRNTDEVREAQRHADYAYRLAVDPPAAKELRLFGLGGLDDRPLRRPPPPPLRAAVAGDAAARAVGGCRACVSCSAANVVVFWSLADAAADGALGARPRSSSSRRPRSARSMIAFGGLNWALDGAAAPVAAVLRLEPAMAPGGRARRRATRAGRRHAGARDPLPRRHASRYPSSRRAGARRLRPDDPGRVVARHRRPERRRQDHARQAAVPPLRPAGAAPSRSTASTSATLDLDAWRARVTAVFQDFVRFELPLRDNVAPGRRARRRDPAPRSPTPGAGGPRRPRHASWRAGYAGGTDLSGGQWQRVALARALCAVQLGRRPGAARRADRAARRARRGRDLRAHPAPPPATAPRS